MIPVIVLLGGFTAVVAWRDYRSAADRAGRDQQAGATSAARSIDRFLHDRFEVLTVLAMDGAFRRADATQVRTDLAKLDAGARGFNGGITWLDRSGAARGSSDANQPLDRSMSSMRAVVAVRATRVPSVQILHGPRLDDPKIMIAVPTVDDAGVMNGVILGFMRLDQLRQLLPGLNLRAATLSIADTDDHLLVGGAIAVLDPVASGTPYREMIATRTGHLTGVTDLRGTQNTVVGYSWVPRARWVVTVAEPTSTLMATARRTLGIELTLLGALAIGAIVAALLEARRLSRAREVDRLRRLSTARLRIAAARLINAGERETVAATVSEAIGDELDVPWCAILDVSQATEPAMIAGIGEIPDQVAGLMIDATTLHRYATVDGVHLTELADVRIPGVSGRVMAVPIGSREAGQVAVLPLQRGRTLTDGERAAVAGIVESAAQAFDRARLLDQDRRTRRRDRMLATVEGELLAAEGVAARARRLVELLVPSWADFATVEVQARRRPSLLAARHRILGRLGATTSIRADDLGVSSTARAVMAEVDMDASGLGPVSVIGVPIRVDGSPVTLVLGRELDGPHAAFRERDGDFADAVGVRAGIAIDRARRDEQDRHIGRELQRSLLRELPERLGDVAIGARYLPGSPELRVGGDWFDVFQIPDGRIAMCVGDVVGHGLAAATAMGRLSSALRAMAIVNPLPDAVLNNLEVFAFGTDGARLTTVAYLLIDPVTGEASYRLAGHPPPIVITPGEPARFLWEGRAAPLGVLGDEDERAGHVTLQAGSTVLLFSDGLFERRGEVIDASLSRLTTIVDGISHLSPQLLADRVIRDSLGGRPQADDICVIAARLEHVGDPAARHEFRPHSAVADG